MQTLSDRLNRLTPSATLAMSQRSAELKAQGVDVINMSVGEPDFNTPDHIKEAAIRAVQENYSRYSPVPGYPALKQAIVNKLKNENGLEYAPSQILCSNGAKQSVCNVIMAIVDKGDEVIIVSLGKKATVLETPDRAGKVSVQAGIIKTKADISDLRLHEEEAKIISGGAKRAAGSYKMTVSRDFRDEIDLRGKTGEEAWGAGDKSFDEAQLAGFHTVRLIHGKGTGALKKYLWEALRKDRRVSTYRIGQFGEGDGGVTVVELK